MGRRPYLAASPAELFGKPVGVRHEVRPRKRHDLRLRLKIRSHPSHGPVSRSGLRRHCFLERCFDAPTSGPVVDLRRLQPAVPEKLLQKLLRHPAVGEVLRDSVPKQVWVDLLGDPRVLGRLFHDLLNAPLRVAPALTRPEERSRPPVAEMKPELVRQRPEDRDVAGLLPLPHHTNLSVAEGDVGGIDLHEGAYPGPRLEKDPHHQSAATGVVVSSLEEGLQLLRRQPLGRAFTGAVRRREPDLPSRLLEEVGGLVVGVAPSRRIFATRRMSAWRSWLFSFSAPEVLPVAAPGFGSSGIMSRSGNYAVSGLPS